MTRSSVATTKIVAGRMLAVPEIASCMADFDEIQGVLDDFQNPFDCHWRLRAMLDKTADCGMRTHSAGAWKGSGTIQSLARWDPWTYRTSVAPDMGAT